MESKWCPRCKETKPFEDFYNYLSRKGIRTARKHCKVCSKLIQEEWQASKGTTLTEYHAKWHKTRVAKDPDFCRRQKLRHWEIKLGLPCGWFQAQYEKQQGLCGICGKPETTNGTRKHTKLEKRMAIDHSHETEKVRGLLCMSCNTKLAVLENAEFVAQARAYLTQYQP